MAIIWTIMSVCFGPFPMGRSLRAGIFFQTRLHPTNSSAPLRPADEGSFHPQTLDGVGNRCFYSLEAYLYQGNENCPRSRHYKYPPTDPDTIDKTLQPLVHKIPGDGRCDQEGNEDQDDKVLAQQ